MCKLVEELCDTDVGDDLIPRTIPSKHRIIQLPAKKELDCVVCSDRTVPVGVHVKCLEQLDHETKKRKII